MAYDPDAEKKDISQASDEELEDRGRDSYSWEAQQAEKARRAKKVKKVAENLSATVGAQADGLEG